MDCDVVILSDSDSDEDNLKQFAESYENDEQNGADSFDDCSGIDPEILEFYGMTVSRSWTRTAPSVEISRSPSHVECNKEYKLDVGEFVTECKPFLPIICCKSDVVDLTSDDEFDNLAHQMVNHLLKYLDHCCASACCKVTCCFICIFSSFCPRMKILILFCLHQ